MEEPEQPATGVPALPPERRSTRWSKGTSGNPSGRKSGAEKLRQILDPRRKDLCERAIAMAMDGDSVVMKALLDKLSPPQRAESPIVFVPALAAAPSLAAKAEAIVAAVGLGQIGPDAATQLLQGLAAACKVVEFDQLQRQIDELKRQLAGRTL